MEDFILREIDRLGEMLLKIARKMGLLDGETPDYSLKDVKEEFDKASLPFDLDTVLLQKNPVWYLVEAEKLTGFPFFAFGQNVDIFTLINQNIYEQTETSSISFCPLHCISGDLWHRTYCSRNERQ